MKGIRFFAMLTAAGLLSLAPAALAQSEEKPKQESLAEAARRLRAQKPSSGMAKVYTNDNLSVGAAAVPSADSGAASLSAADAGAAAPRAVSEEEEQERAQAEKAVKEGKARLEQLKRDLELQQRDYDLARQQFYSNPAYANDSAGQRRLNDQQAQIDSKKDAIAASEATLKELEAKLKDVQERLGPKQQAPLSPEEQQRQWADRLRPLQQELAQVEAEIERMSAQLPNSPAPSAEGNDFTRNRIRNLEAKRDELRRKISDLQDEARRSGAPSSWTQPPQ